MKIEALGSAEIASFASLSISLNDDWSNLCLVACSSVFLWDQQQVVAVFKHNDYSGKWTQLSQQFGQKGKQ